ncbi:hypothetical protein SNE40_001251 [Patella caerulea]|uniref:Uncharacterized protein n=1 Tax=Patella caerulea TaxID=87958 RepID=A0AAN8QAY7_PATCE
MTSVILFLTIISQLGLLQGAVDYPDYKDHKCTRTCEDGGEIMTCIYNFTLEYYYTLSKACYDCPRNITDCKRPHCITADGVPRSVVVVNRMLPGPGIHVCENDMIVVNVKNQLETNEGTTIHWHGIYQKGSQWMDGVPMLTQCPIPTHSTFQYRFKAANAGTHFWHAHAGVQRADGIFGHLVVRQPPSREVHFSLYDKDLVEHAVMVNDWLNQLTIDRFAEHHHSDGDNKPRLMIINGKAAFKNFTYDDEPGQIYRTSQEIFYVEPNKRYRFRVVSNGILNCPLQVSVDDHPMIVIASDGKPFDPIVVDSFNIFAGERYDFILETNKTIGNYWFRVRGLADCGADQKRGQALAIVRYTGSLEEAPAGATDYDSSARGGRLLNPWNEAGTESKIPVSELTAMVPDDDSLKEKPDKKFYLAFDFNPIDNFHFHHPDLYPMLSIVKEKHLYSPQINGISNMLPHAPPLTQFDDIPEDMFCNTDTIQKNCREEFCQCVHRLQVDLNDTVEIIMLDEGVTFNANHPTHLHGHSFRVVAIGKLNTTTSLEEVKALDEGGFIKRKLSKAVSKDSVTVPDGGYTVIRFYADNPGVWFFHCHIEFHVEIGMGLIIQVGSKDQMPRKPKGFPTCGNFEYSGLEEEKEEDTLECPESSSISLGNERYTLCGILTFVVLFFFDGYD